MLQSVTNPTTFTGKSKSMVNDTSEQKLNTLLQQKNIVGVGISEKISKRKRTGKIGMTFYVEKKIDLSELPEDALIPKVFAMPSGSRKDIITDVIEIGKMVPQTTASGIKLQPGFAICHSKSGLGTIGAVVTDGKQNYLLSNCHVLALNGKAKKGDVIIQPKSDTDTTGPTVAQLKMFKTFISGEGFTNDVDCAIASPNKELITAVIPAIKGNILSQGVIKPKRGMQVFKVGASTGKTRSEIIDADFIVKIDYADIGEVRFVNQILCKRYTDGGDSGALVVDAKTGKAVGLHFAGGAKGSVCNPIQKVLDAMNVKLVTGAPVTVKKAGKPSKTKTNGNRKAG